MSADVDGRGVPVESDTVPHRDSWESDGEGSRETNRSVDSPSTTAGRSKEIEDRNLRVVLEIDRGGPCYMDGVDGEILDVDVRVDDGVCYSDVTVCEPTEDGDRVVTKHHSDEVCSHCPTVVFTDHGCVPHILRQAEGSFFVKTFLPETAAVAELVEGLREVCARVRLVSITDTGDGEDLVEEVFEVDLSGLTPKQREALELAISAGYYESGEASGMGALADRLGISKSAFSQRLSRAELKVMRQFEG